IRGVVPWTPQAATGTMRAEIDVEIFELDRPVPVELGFRAASHSEATPVLTAGQRVSRRWNCGCAGREKVEFVSRFPERKIRRLRRAATSAWPGSRPARRPSRTAVGAVVRF